MSRVAHPPTIAVLCALLFAAIGCGEDESEPPVQSVATSPAVTAPDTTASPTIGEPSPARGDEEGTRKPPRRRFRATTRGVRDLVERTVGREAPQGRRRVTEARCSDGACRIRYFAAHRGRGRILEDVLAILERIFSDRSVRSATILVHHQVVGRHKDERLPILELRCTRDGWRAYERSNGGRGCDLGRRTGQDREAPHAKRGGGPPQGRGGGPPDR